MSLSTAAALRLFAFPFAQNLWDDAPARAEIAARWAASPGLWWSYADVYQYGPLPVLLGGLANLVVPDRELAPRLPALLFGLLGVALVVRLAARLSGPRAGLAAGLAVALAPMHVQASVTFASEGFFLAFALGCLERALARDPRGMALWAFAASTSRFDAWLWLPLLALWWIATAPRDRRARALAQAATLALGPASILLANALQAGDPLAPLRHVSREHVELAAAARGYWGDWRFRLAQPLYWPAAVLACLSPGYGAAALVAGAKALLRHSTARVAVTAGLVPPVLYAARAVVLGTFRPMARFALAPAVLLAATLPPLSAAETALFASIAVATNAGLATAAFTAQPDTAAESLATLSPIPRLPPDLLDAVRAVRDAPGPVVLDTVETYEDILVAWHAGADRWSLQHPEPGLVPARIVALRGGPLGAQLRRTGHAFGAGYRLAGGWGRAAWWDRYDPPPQP